MGTLAAARQWPKSDLPGNLAGAQPPLLSQPRWSLGFIGVLAYLVIEYTRLAAMYPVLLPLYIGKVAIAVAVLGLLFAPRARWARSTAATGIDFALLGFLAISLMSASLAQYPVHGWPAFFDILRWGLIFLLVSRIVSSYWRIRFAVYVIALLNLKLAQFVIRSYLDQRDYGRSEMFLTSHGVGAGSTGFFGNGGDFGVAMCVIWPLAGALLFGERKNFLRFLLLLLFLLSFVSILLCGSRGAILGAAVAALAAFVRRPRLKIAITMALVAVVGMAYLLPGATWERILAVSDPKEVEYDSTSATRLRLWQAGVKMFEDNPVLGVGPGNFRPQYAYKYGLKEPDGTAWAPHSIYIQALSELGLAGSLAFLTMAALLFRINSRTREQLLANGFSKDSFEYCLTTGLDLGLVGYLVSGAFLTVLYYPHFWILLGLAAGLNRASARLPARENATPARPAAKLEPAPA